MHRDEVRLGITRVEYPRILIWTGSLLMVLSFLTYLEEPEAPAALHVLDAITALVLVTLGFVMLRFHPPGSLMPWLFGTGATFLVFALLYQVVIDQKAVTFVYVTIVLTSLGPTILSWGPFTTVALISMAGIWVVVTTWELGHPTEWILVALAALLVSAVLLRTRLRSIDALADASELARRLAVTDELTGLLNRHGLSAQIPRIAAMAGRFDDTIFALFIDIDGLKVANDQHGHAFGDDVIEVSGHAVLASVRGGDLVARYGGDEIVVVGIGHHPDPAAFARRLDEHVTASGIDRAKWPGHLSVGFAEGDPAQDSVDDLIQRADADMYGRRGARQ
jgi:diguanylate cyclase (GGDEF)-like protein